MDERKNILLTGRPGVGKTTLAVRVAESLKKSGLLAGGFYTLEVRGRQGRIGFDVHTLDGKTGPLARAGFKSAHTLGRYGIDLERFESLALPALEEAIKAGGVVVIDEIGFMELKSRRFRELAVKALDSHCPVLATVMRTKFAFPEMLKSRDDVELINVTAQNRDALLDTLVQRLVPLKR